MKKVVSIFLSVLILVSSTGFALQRHYCPMSGKSTYSFTDAKQCCRKMPGKCCKNTQIKFEKLKNDYSPSSYNNIPSPDFSSIAIYFVQSGLGNCFVESNSNSYSFSHAPPPKALSRSILFHSILV